MLQELLNGASRDPSNAVRQAARAALSELPLTALSLRPLFAMSDEAGLGGEVDTPAHKTRRRSKAESSIKQAAEGLDLLELAGLLLTPVTHGVVLPPQEALGVNSLCCRADQCWP